MLTPEQKRSNRRLGLILASVALALFFGFIAKGALGWL
ncbi:MAG TPA: cytochrome oxidase small assembly protein [Burkholderiaceae bacterium]|nr:cytochrome oxidase small assembly protein [Burkholderiaceae bacterium]